jgi:hypothetical protein
MNLDSIKFDKITPKIILVDEEDIELDSDDNRKNKIC